LHIQDISRHLRVDEYKVPLPPGGEYLESQPLKSQVAMRVFGEEALMSSGTIKAVYRETVSCWLKRVWENRRKQLATRVARSSRECEEFDKALEGEWTMLPGPPMADRTLGGLNAGCASEAQRSKTPDALRVASVKLKKWRGTAEMNLEVQDPPFQQREEALELLWGELGFADETERLGEDSSSHPNLLLTHR
jgi:hypothetical protein